MASTAEAVRDQDEAPKAEIPPMLARPEEPKAEVPSLPAPLEPMDWGKIAASIYQKSFEMMPSKEESAKASEEARAAREKAARSSSDMAANLEAQVTAAKTEGLRFAEEARQKQAAINKPQVTPPPAQGLRPFLAASPHESPETSITKLITGLATFAQMIGGGRASARGALSAMTGAIEGWKAGDRERADREFKVWEARTKSMLKQWEIELGGYEMWFQASGMPLEQMIQGVKLQALANGNRQLADAADVAVPEKIMQEIEKRQEHAIKMQEWAGNLIGMKDTRDQQRLAMEKYRDELVAAGKQREAEVARHNKAMEEAKREAEEAKGDAIAAHPAYDYDKGMVRQVTKREEMDNARALQTGQPAKLRSLPPQQVQLLERLAVAPPILDRIDALIDKINAAAPGENITQGLINRMKKRAGISADMQEITTLNLDNALENAAALSGGQPRIAILTMLRGEATPSESMTAEVAHRAVATTRTTIYNRGQTMTGDPETIPKMAKELRGYGGPKKDSEDMIRVISPDGTPGKVPKGTNLGDYPGWKKAP